jgi:N-[(2S)-2-amino-2-carboxyethyl]-L-glutamate dehydrogenase
MMSSARTIRFLSLENVVACGGADISLAAGDIAKGFNLLVDGKIINPAKTSLRSKTGDEHSTGLVNFLPAYVELGDEQVIGCKMLGAMPANTEIGLPRATGLIVLFDCSTKTPLCVMDAQVISATRTGAVSYLAAQKLADPDTEEIGMVGAGVNMRTQLLGISMALPAIRKVRVYSRDESKNVFAREMASRTGLAIVAVDQIKQAVAECKLYVTCVPIVTEPLVRECWVKERGLTVFNIGAYENEATLLKRMDRIVTDIWEHAKHRDVQTPAIAVRDGVIPDSRIEDLAPILSGKAPGRQSCDENIFFCPVGLGFEDTLMAWRVYNEAEKKGVGTRLTLWESAKWI